MGREGVFVNQKVGFKDKSKTLSSEKSIFWNWCSGRGLPLLNQYGFIAVNILIDFFAGRGYYELDLNKHILSTEKKMDTDTDASFPKSNSSFSSVEASVPKMVGNQTLTRTGSRALCGMSLPCGRASRSQSPLTQVTAV